VTSLLGKRRKLKGDLLLGKRRKLKGDLPLEERGES
jgi:hypothetical protein